MVLQEACRQRRAELHLTNQEIANRSGVPIGTVNRYFSNGVKDPSIYTVAPICKALGISLDNYFDIKLEDKDLEKEDRELTIACRELRLTLEHKDEYIDAMKKELHIRRWVTASLAIALAAVAVLAAGYLIYFDFSDPNHGIFREATHAFLIPAGK